MSPVNVEKQRIRLSQLDGIKGIICFFIIFIHYSNRMGCDVFPATFIPSLLVDKGWMFVELFFIISGFLMAYTMKNRMRTTTFKGFMSTRFDRLLPPILFATLLEIVVKIISMIVLNSGSRLSVTEIINSLTFASTYIYNGDPLPSVLWYIHVLILCYIVYYIICRFRRTTVYYVCIVALFFFGWVLISQSWDVPFLFPRIGRGYFAFSLGLLIYEFQAKITQKAKVYISYFALAMTVVALLLGIKYSFERVFGDITFTFYLLFFPTIMLAALNINWVKRILALPPFVFLGKISMAVFLIHVPILNFFSIYIHPEHGILYREDSLIRYDTVQGFFFIIASIILVSVIWHYSIEKKVIPLFLQKVKLMVDKTGE